MRYDPGGQGIQLLYRLLRVLHAARMALEVFSGGTVWSGLAPTEEKGVLHWFAKERRIIIHSFRTMF